MSIYSICILTYYRTLLSEGELYINILSDVTFWERVVYWHTSGRYFLGESCIYSLQQLLQKNTLSWVIVGGLLHGKISLSIISSFVHLRPSTRPSINLHKTLVYVQFWGRVVYWHTIGRYSLRASWILTYYRTLLSEGELYIDILSDVTLWGRVACCMAKSPCPLYPLLFICVHRLGHLLTYMILSSCTYYC
jgi:hypothetical protein